MPDKITEDEPVVISSKDARGGQVLKRSNFGDALVPVLIRAVLLSVVGMGLVAFFSARGGA